MLHPIVYKADKKLHEFVLAQRRNSWLHYREDVIIGRFIFITPAFNNSFHIIIKENGDWLWVATQCPFGFAAFKNQVVIMNIFVFKTGNVFWIHTIPKVAE